MYRSNFSLWGDDGLGLIGAKRIRGIKGRTYQLTQDISYLLYRMKSHYSQRGMNRMHDLASLRRMHLCLWLSMFISLRTDLRLPAPELSCLGTFSMTDLRNFPMLDKIPWVPRQTPTTSNESSTSNGTVPQTECYAGDPFLSPNGQDHPGDGHHRTEPTRWAKARPIQIIQTAVPSQTTKTTFPPHTSISSGVSPWRCRRVQA